MRNRSEISHKPQFISGTPFNWQDGYSESLAMQTSNGATKPGNHPSALKGLMPFMHGLNRASDGCPVLLIGGASP